MESTLLVAAVAALGGAAAVWGLLALPRGAHRADLEAMLVAAREETDDLRRRLDELAERTSSVEPRQAEFVITHVGDRGEGAARAVVPDRVVLSATLGEPLVKVAAFTHGVRRALSAESRNRIWFEMRREVRAARRRRRRLVKDYLREARAAERAQESVA
jgi:hypothetical protein